MKEAPITILPLIVERSRVFASYGQPTGSGIYIAGFIVGHSQDKSIQKIVLDREYQVMPLTAAVKRLSEIGECLPNVSRSSGVASGTLFPPIG